MMFEIKSECNTDSGDDSKNKTPSKRLRKANLSKRCRNLTKKRREERKMEQGKARSSLIVTKGEEIQSITATKNISQDVNDETYIYYHYETIQPQMKGVCKFAVTCKIDNLFLRCSVNLDRLNDNPFKEHSKIKDTWNEEQNIIQQYLDVFNDNLEDSCSSSDDSNFETSIDNTLIPKRNVPSRTARIKVNPVRNELANEILALLPALTEQGANQTKSTSKIKRKKIKTKKNIVLEEEFDLKSLTELTNKEIENDDDIIKIEKSNTQIVANQSTAQFNSTILKTSSNYAAVTSSTNIEPPDSTGSIQSDSQNLIKQRLENKSRDSLKRVINFKQRGLKLNNSKGGRLANFRERVIIVPPVLIKPKPDSSIIKTFIKLPKLKKASRDNAKLIQFAVKSKPLVPIKPKPPVLIKPVNIQSVPINSQTPTKIGENQTPKIAENSTRRTYTRRKITTKNDPLIISTQSIKPKATTVVSSDILTSGNQSDLVSISPTANILNTVYRNEISSLSPSSNINANRIIPTINISPNTSKQTNSSISYISNGIPLQNSTTLTSVQSYWQNDNENIISTKTGISFQNTSNLIQNTSNLIQNTNQYLIPSTIQNMNQFTSQNSVQISAQNTYPNLNQNPQSCLLKRASPRENIDLGSVDIGGNSYRIKLEYISPVETDNSKIYKKSENSSIPSLYSNPVRINSTVTSSSITSPISSPYCFKNVSITPLMVPVSSPPKIISSSQNNSSYGSGSVGPLTSPTFNFNQQNNTSLTRNDFQKIQNIIVSEFPKSNQNISIRNSSVGDFNATLLNPSVQSNSSSYFMVNNNGNSTINNQSAITLVSPNGLSKSNLQSQPNSSFGLVYTGNSNLINCSKQIGIATNAIQRKEQHDSKLIKSGSSNIVARTIIPTAAPGKGLTKQIGIATNSVQNKKQFHKINRSLTNVVERTIIPATATSKRLSLIPIQPAQFQTINSSTSSTQTSNCNTNLGVSKFDSISSFIDPRILKAELRENKLKMSQKKTIDNVNVTTMSNFKKILPKTIDSSASNDDHIAERIKNTPGMTITKTTLPTTDFIPDVFQPNPLVMFSLGQMTSTNQQTGLYNLPIWPTSS